MRIVGNLLTWLKNPEVDHGLEERAINNQDSEADRQQDENVNQNPMLGQAGCLQVIVCKKEIYDTRPL
jgi:hypothetical protein